MKKQFNEIHKANSNYEENKSSCSWSDSSTQSLIVKMENTLIWSQN